MPQAKYRVIKRNIENLCTQNQINSEFKWSYTTKSKLRKYKPIADYFFECIEREWISFHVLFVDFQRFDHELRPDGNKNESLKRMYSQIIIHRFGKHFGSENNLYVYPDQAKELRGLDSMKAKLNDNLSSYHGIKSSPIKAIEFRNSEDHLFLQFNDIILGGLCYQRNRRHEESEAGRPKSNFAGYIHGRTGIPDLSCDTPRSKMNISVWNFDSDKLKGGR